MSKGYGFGKLYPFKIFLKLMQRLFSSDLVEVQGLNMYVIPGDNEEYATYGVYGELDTKTVLNEIKKGDIVVDVGASIGYYTLLFARQVGNEGKVFSFEPKPERFEILKKNVEINGYQNVILENKAVMNKKGKVNFYVTHSGKAGFKYARTKKQMKKFTQLVEAESIGLDDYFRERNLIDKINFIKSDVDGPEYAVLQSASSILKNKSLRYFVEWNPELIRIVGSDPEKMLDMFWENNFKIYLPHYKENKFELADKYAIMNADTHTNVINLLCKKE